ncbi:hypothetical protein GF314_11570, partial [bacterium]|nr:hypothetical protein [bacterium]
MRLVAALTLVLSLAVALAAVADPVRADRVLRLGPLPAAPGGDELDPRVHATAEVVPELDPRAGWPDLDWTETGAASGVLTLPEPGVWWLAARLVTDRWAELAFDVGDAVAATVWVDGEQVEGETPVPSGACLVLVRAVADAAGATVQLAAEGDAAIAWDVQTRLDLSRFDRARMMASLGSLAVAPRGKLVARHVSRRNLDGEGRRGAVAVLDGRGELVADDLGGPDARPVAFRPDGEALLMRRSGDEGTDLLLWTSPRGPMHTVVTDEPGLGLMRFDPSGRRLLLASTRGLEASDPDDDRRRWDALRERVTDWNPRPHLHVIDLETGLRRVLTRPGDHTLDDAAW